MNTPYPDFLKKHLPEKEITILRERDALHSYQFNGHDFVRLSQEYKDRWRGNVFHEYGIIPGYPGIMRILHLENGINRYFKEKFYIEEKMDGYNVRVAIIDGLTLAFTRGGFICPFSTDRIPDVVNLDFFKKYPGYIICGEVVGPGSPYNTEVIPYIKEDIGFFVFDVINEGGQRIYAEERYKIMEIFGMRQVRRWGPFAAADILKIKEIVLELDKNSREGIVIKSISDNTRAKYVTLSSCLRDLQATTHLITELPAGFFMHRILRAVFFCHEFGIPFSSEYLTDASNALYLIPEQTLKNVAAGDSIKEYFNIKVKQKNTIEKLMIHLNRSGVRTQLVSVEKSGEYYAARFYRTYLKGTRELRQGLMGKGFFD